MSRNPARPGWWIGCFPFAAVMVAALGLLPAVVKAQETCTIDETLEKSAAGASLLQHEDCEDTLTLFACTKGGQDLSITQQSFDQAGSGRFKVRLKAAGKVSTREAVVGPVPDVMAARAKQLGTGGTDDTAATVSLPFGDPVVRSLLASRDVGYETDAMTTTLYLSRAGAKKLKALIDVCTAP